MPAKATLAAPAKVNLALHVCRLRPDGYHDLETIVAFADIADILTVSESETIALATTGPFAAAITHDNLVLQAAERLALEAAKRGLPIEGAALTLEKNLPVAAGLGGGSADAAAAMHLLNRHWGLGFTTTDLAAIAARLGADVPVCVHAKPLIATGIGDKVEIMPAFPAFGIVLAHPGIPLSTPAVFGALNDRNNPPLPDRPARFGDRQSALAWLSKCRNDLETPALDLVPEIGTVMAALLQCPNVLLVRMSGSGATCFALFDTPEAAIGARKTLPSGLWAHAGTLRSL